MIVNVFSPNLIYIQSEKVEEAVNATSIQLFRAQRSKQTNHLEVVIGKWCSRQENGILQFPRLSLTDFVRTLLEIKTDAYEVVYFITNVVIRKGVIDDFGFVRQATKSLSYNAHSHTSLLRFFKRPIEIVRFIDHQAVNAKLGDIHTSELSHKLYLSLCLA